MYLDIDNYIKQYSGGEVLYSLRGDFDSSVINNIFDNIEEKMISLNEPYRLRKKVYNVLVESLQNLYHHVDNVPPDFCEGKFDKYGLILIQKEGECYRVITGNFVRSNHYKKLKDKLDKINHSSYEEIKELYKYILNHQRISVKGGGGLGLVDIAKKTASKLNYTFLKYDEDYLFYFLNVLVEENRDESKWDETNILEDNGADYNRRNL